MYLSSDQLLIQKLMTEYIMVLPQPSEQYLSKGEMFLILKMSVSAWETLG